MKVKRIKYRHSRREETEKVGRLYGNGQVQDAIKMLRKHRCGLMDSLHESQWRVDCLDFLVWRMEKEKQ